VVARQPIFDRSLAVCGYELLYRALEATAARFENAVAATAEVLVTAALDIGLRRLTGPLPAYINFPRELLAAPLPPPIEPRRVVIEVLEDVSADAELVSALAALRRRGYRIALDDFEPRAGNAALLDQADIVKIDIQSCPAERLPQLVGRLRGHHIELIAEKVETREQLECCQALGFDGYQGYFLQRPETFSARRVPTNRLAVLKLLVKLNEPDTSLADIETVIACDVGICYRLLRCANSSFYGLPNPIDSIRRAIIVLGLEELRAICAAVLLTGFDDRPTYLTTQALVRARMCEALCVRAGLNDRQSYFIAGLLSLVGALLGMPLPDALLILPLGASLRAALLHGDGTIGEALTCVQRYEQGVWAQVGFRALPARTIAEAYQDAVSWADDVWNLLSQTA
jgi:EAL and modified HD-GYP domain-containing signal transduction protein